APRSGLASSKHCLTQHVHIERHSACRESSEPAPQFPGPCVKYQMANEAAENFARHWNGEPRREGCETPSHGQGEAHGAREERRRPARNPSEIARRHRPVVRPDDAVDEVHSEGEAIWM